MHLLIDFVSDLIVIHKYHKKMYTLAQDVVDKINNVIEYHYLNGV